MQYWSPLLTLLVWPLSLTFIIFILFIFGYFSLSWNVATIVILWPSYSPIEKKKSGSNSIKQVGPALKCLSSTLSGKWWMRKKIPKNTKKYVISKTITTKESCRFPSLSDDKSSLGVPQKSSIGKAGWFHYNCLKSYILN